MINLEEFLDRKEFRRRTNDAQTTECNTNDNMNDMNRIPNEIVSEIFFGYLNWNDHIRLSRVCKRFYALLQRRSTKTISELAIFLNQTPQSERLYFGDKVISYSNTVRLPSMLCLYMAEFRERFKNVEHLLVVNNPDDDFHSTNIDFSDNTLNGLGQLRHLELREIQQIKGKLDLPLLTSLYVSTRLQSNFTILSPSLMEFAYFGKARPTLVHTKLLQVLAAQQLTQPFLGYGFLNKRSQCCSLRKLVAHEPYQIKWVLNQFQDQLEQVVVTNQLKAREIRDLVRVVEDLPLELNYFDINMKNAAFKSALESLHDESVFFVETLDSAFVRLFVKNLKDFQPLVRHVRTISIVGIDDNSLQISDDFTTKLNLSELSIESSGKEKTKLSSSALLSFMNGSPRLTRLHLKSIDTKQKHIDQLPAKFPLLNELTIKDCSLSNLEFIQKFASLHTFTTNCDLNVQQTTKLLLQCCPVRIVFC